MGQVKGKNTPLDYIWMPCISYDLVYELKWRISLARDLDLIEKGVLGKLKEDIAESPDKSGLKTPIKFLENKSLTP